MVIGDRLKLVESLVTRELPIIVKSMEENVWKTMLHDFRLKHEMIVDSLRSFLANFYSKIDGIFIYNSFCQNQSLLRFLENTVRKPRISKLLWMTSQKVWKKYWSWFRALKNSWNQGMEMSELPCYTMWLLSKQFYICLFVQT